MLFELSTPAPVLKIFSPVLQIFIMGSKHEVSYPVDVTVVCYNTSESFLTDNVVFMVMLD